MSASFFSSLSNQLVPYKSAPLILVAYSGGVDSEFLLHHVARWAKEHNCLDKVLALYIHHGLSENADMWAQHCAHSAKQYGVRFVVEHVQLACDGSIEQEARNARYNVFSNYMMDCDDLDSATPPVLLTAHHQDDQVETFLLALKRGSGPTGLSAMAKSTAFSDGILLRPMLEISRVYIERTAQDLSLTWIEDESNADTKYDRNFLRHEIIPQLKARFMGWNKAVCRSAELCAAQDLLLSELLEERLQDAINDDKSTPFYLGVGLKLSALIGQSRQLQAALIRAWIQGINAHYSDSINRFFPLPSRGQLDEILDSVIIAKEDANPQVCWDNISIRRYKSCLYLIPQYQDISHEVVSLGLDTTTFLPDSAGFIELNSAYSDDGLVLRAPMSNEQVTIRFSGSGLTPHPVGRQGKRKLKKLYQEYQVPSWMRTRVPLLFYGDQLVAVAGLFVVEGYQATEGNAVYLHYF